MTVLALDVSTSTGWALFEGAQLIDFGLLKKSKDNWQLYGDYPWAFLDIAKDLANQVLTLVSKFKPTTIVIEETNKTGRFGSRHSQKLLEFLHFGILQEIRHSGIQVLYINTSDWRKKLNLSVSESKKKAKPFLKELEALTKNLKSSPKDKTLKAKVDGLKSDLKKRCLHGKIDKKSISVAYANSTYSLSLLKGDNDMADAICLGAAFVRGVQTLDNSQIFDNNRKQKK